ncbi:Cytochrome c2 precursor [Pseudoruegeria aquimaris]|uniref:Cytochrome c2 n=1 Tax=Pseudoruegeria aquimaris TaxID=393663 RepID=A0A1Y5S290_9RHOB|nr:c-type cytochrome [Pseudoruegeria aquimaris]SLN30425.1 Cytochrome c2 precursor [Pseudoruegeria aquimaris]
MPAPARLFRPSRPGMPAAVLLAFALSLMQGAGGAAAQEFYTLKGHGGPVKGIDVAPEGGAILTASFDNTVGLWEGGTPRWLEGHAAAVNAVHFLGDGRAASGGDDFAVLLWDLAAGTARRLEGHEGKVISLSVSPDAGTLASASWDGSIGLWDLDTLAPRFLTGHGAGVNATVFSPDGSTLYSASTDGTLRVWDVASGQEKRLLLRHGFGINTLVLNASAGWLAYGAVDGGTRIVDAQTGESLADFTLDRRPILAMDLSRDGRLLAVGDGEGYIMIIDTERGRIVNDFKAALRGPVWALRFSEDGRNIHAGGLDDAMYSWPVDAEGDEAAMAAGPRSFLEDPAGMGNGERQFKRKCSICHTLTPDGQRRAGPSLHALFGRPAGSLPGYSYSETLQTADIIWNDETIDALFDLGPDHYIPGSKMPMQRITAQQDRDDLIAYLRSASSEEGKEE